MGANINKFQDKYKFFEIKNNFVKYASVKSICMYGKRLNSGVLVSVIIPTYRRPELLYDAIKSVLSQVGFSDFEIVIVDNDDSGEFEYQIIEYLKDFSDSRICYYKNECNIGMFGNFNRGIELSKGEWIAVLSDDDILFCDYLYKMTNVLKTEPNLDRVECLHLRFKDRGKIAMMEQQKVDGDITKQSNISYRKINIQMYIGDNFTAVHSQLYRREYAVAIGGFSLSLPIIADYAFNVLYLHLYPNSVQINEYLCGYRQLCNESAKKSASIACLKWYGRLSAALLQIYPSKLWWCYRQAYFIQYYNSYMLKNVWIRKPIGLVCTVCKKLLGLVLDMPGKIGNLG